MVLGAYMREIIAGIMALGMGIFVLMLLFGGSVLAINNTSTIYNAWTSFTGSINQVVLISIALIIVFAAMALYEFTQGGMGGSRS